MFVVKCLPNINNQTGLDFLLFVLVFDRQDRVFYCDYYYYVHEFFDITVKL